MAVYYRKKLRHCEIFESFFSKRRIVSRYNYVSPLIYTGWANRLVICCHFNSPKRETTLGLDDTRRYMRVAIVILTRTPVRSDTIRSYKLEITWTDLSLLLYGKRRRGNSTFGKNRKTFSLVFRRRFRNDRAPSKLFPGRRLPDRIKSLLRRKFRSDLFVHAPPRLLRYYARIVVIDVITKIHKS